MRFLHTSDWHLGQEFYKFDRYYEQQQFLDDLISKLDETKTDVLLIAGDVFDVPNPPAQAQKMFFEFLVAAKRLCPKLQTVVIAGNHDSGTRLEAPAQILTAMDVTVVGRIRSTPEGIESDDNTFLIPLYLKSHDNRSHDNRSQDSSRPESEPDSSNGSSSESKQPSDCETPHVICVALPFLRNQDIQWHEESLAYPEAVLRTYRQAIAMARAQYGKSIPLIGMGHLHARGGASSKDSERPLIIGGEEAVVLSAIADQFVYFGLGHLHLAQSVGEHKHVRYSGSPLPMSFSEINYKHQVRLVDLKADGSTEQQALPIKRAVDLLRLPAKPSLDSVVIKALEDLTLPPLEEKQWPYLEVQVLSTGPNPDLAHRIDEALKAKPVKLLKISASRPETLENNENADIDEANREKLSLGPVGPQSFRKLDPLTVFQQMHKKKYNTPPDEELLSTFQEVLREITLGGEE